MFQVDRYDFTTESLEDVRKLRHWNIDIGKNWPVVYIINDTKEAYVGETVNAAQRFDQHLQNPQRRKLTEVRILSDKTFNKSVTLDLEAFLISHMASDEKYVLQNGNSGLKDHEYFAKSEYKDEFKRIWNKLQELKVVDHSISWIENSDLYKYSPYKSLGEEQLKAERDIVQAIAEYSEEGKRATVVVRGGAGTGKTILAIYLIKLFSDIIHDNPLSDPSMSDLIEEDPDTIFAAESIGSIQKIGLVLPQKSLQTSLKEVFRKLNNLTPKMILSPADVVKNYMDTGVPFDLLIIDESHRLKCRDKGHLSNYAVFDKCNRLLGLDPQKGTELDWIMACSRNQVLFRDDELQTVRPCDIDGERFKEIIGTIHCERALNTQFRCEGGDEYIDYIRRIISCVDVTPRQIDGYDLRLYSDCAQMVADIKEKDAEMDLCRTVAGYAWPWDRKNPNVDTIHIQGKSYRWNTTYNNWIGKPNSVNEIGCIHTVQGYDLNYCGVIIGEDIKYDLEKKKIYAVKENYYDQQGKSGVADDPEALCKYLCNIYLTLLTRGIKGTYIYVCDEALQNYFARFIRIL